MNVGIVVPTLNRPEFVIRQARYYAAQEDAPALYIGDSSTDENAAIIRRGLEELQGRLQARYFYWPEKNDFQVIRDLLARVQEPYVAYVGDDDLQIPPTLAAAAEFLDNHPDYNYARGQAFTIKVAGDGARGAIEISGPYDQIPNEESTAAARLLRLFQNYNVTLFSVQRTEHLRDAFAAIPDPGVHRTMTELLPCAWTVARGKGKVLEDRLGFLRQVHERHYSLPGTFDVLLDDTWPLSGRTFVNEIARQVQDVDGGAAEEAREQARGAIARYIHRSLAKRYPFPAAVDRVKVEAAPRPALWKRVLKRIAGIAGIPRNSEAARAPLALDDFPESAALRALIQTGEVPGTKTRS